MTNVESMDYTHSHPSIIASLFGTVHCPFSPWELVQTSSVHPNPVIWYALSHINLLISSSKHPPYLPIMACPQPFRDILPCNFHHHHIHDLSIYCHIALHDRKIASMMFSWLVRFLCHWYARSLHISVHRRRYSYRVILCSRHWVVILSCK